jgi:hypothetical protein
LDSRFLASLGMTKVLMGKLCFARNDKSYLSGVMAFAFETLMRTFERNGSVERSKFLQLGIDCFAGADLGKAVGGPGKYWSGIQQYWCCI